ARRGRCAPSTARRSARHAQPGASSRRAGRWRRTPRSRARAGHASAPRGLPLDQRRFAGIFAALQTRWSAGTSPPRYRPGDVRSTKYGGPGLTIDATAQPLYDYYDLRIHRIHLALALATILVREERPRLRLQPVTRQMLGPELEGVGEIGSDIGGGLARNPV